MAFPSCTVVGEEYGRSLPLEVREDLRNGAANPVRKSRSYRSLPKRAGLTHREADPIVRMTILNRFESAISDVVTAQFNSGMLNRVHTTAEIKAAETGRKRASEPAERHAKPGLQAAHGELIRTSTSLASNISIAWPAAISSRHSQFLITKLKSRRVYVLQRK